MDINVNISWTGAAGEVFDVTFPVTPTGKARPRHAVGARGVFTPSSTRSAERTLRASLLVRLRGARPISGPIGVVIEARYATPKSWSRPKRLGAIGGPATGKPDIDNVAKLVLDAANGVLWSDDAQVAFMAVLKTRDETPSIHLIATPMAGSDWLEALSSRSWAIPRTAP